MSDEGKIEIRLPDPNQLMVSASPHVHGGESIRKIMFLVVLALLPACFMGVYFFGVDAIRVLAICVVSCVVLDGVCGRILGRPDAWKDGSAVVTGLLLGMILCSNTPWWVCVIGSIIAIVLAKQLFGGLGYNPFNPAIVARIALILGFPKILTTWVPTRFMTEQVAHAADKGGNPLFFSAQIIETMKEKQIYGKVLPFFDSVIDGVTCATPLGEVSVSEELGDATVSKFHQLATWDNIWDYAIGNVGGCIGETSAIALLIGGLFLLSMRIIRWQVPVAYIGTVAIFGALVHFFMGHPAIPGAMFQIVTGGLFIGAFFMATDMVTTPMTGRGCFVFGVGCGVITCVIRDWCAYPEGVMFSILLMNALTPLIDRYTGKKPFGYRPPVNAGGEA